MITRLANKSFLFVMVAVASSAFAQPGQEYNVFSRATEDPDRIMLSMPGNPSTSRGVTWRTNFSTQISIGQITETRSSTGLEHIINSVNGTLSLWEKGDSTAMGHKVIFSDLNPETQYAYRVGDGNNWSEWLQFTTSSAQAEPFNFLYFGDVQKNIKSLGSRILRQAYSHYSNADFMLFVGDIVATSTENDWKEFFYAGGWMFGMIPSMSTPGNHEYDKYENGHSTTFSKHWDQIYVNPRNGPETLMNRTFYIDYQGTRFVSLDSDAIVSSEKNEGLTLNWLENVLDSNPNRWTIVFMHHPVYSCSSGLDTRLSGVKTVFEKYGVDLVLQGHNHAYCRGQYLDGVGELCKNPPLYLVSVAGPNIMEGIASKIQLYQYISVDQNAISVEVFTANGVYYDSFRLLKNKEGSNTLAEGMEAETNSL